MNEQKHLGKGKEVEVTSNEEGFRGAWYLASILKPPPKSAPKKRRESVKAFVQYKTLLTEDGSAPLTEMVEPALIRPLPPPPQPEDAERVFEVGETVDARYRDGWWTGIVRKVLENSRYMVHFDNPPDVIEFERTDLRLNWKWVDGKWVRPEKQQSTGSIFSSGTAVEVNLDIENLRDVWIRAIVVKENGDNSFLVKYLSSRNSDESAMEKVTVDSLHIRPTPPRFVDVNYELLERVDCSYNFGWRAGVITKVLVGRRYTVFFKHGNEDKELSHTELRPHIEWVDGKWVGKSKETLIASDEPEPLGIAQDVAHNPELAGEVERSDAAKDNTLEKTPCSGNACKDLMELPTSTLKTSSLDQNNKRVKLSFRSKKLTEGSSAEKPSSIASGQLKSASNEITNKEAVCDLSTPKTGGAGTRFLKKSLIGDQASPKTKSPFLEKITQTASNDCLFCQHHRSNWKTKRQKVGSSDDQTSNLVKRNVRARRSPSKGQRVLATGKDENTGTAEEINKNDDKTNAVETALILGLKAHASACQIPVWESEKLKRDQKNFNDSVGGKSVETTQQTGGGSSQRRKRGRPRKLGVVSSKASEAGDQQNGAGGVADLMVVKDYVSNGVDLPAHEGLELIASQDASRQKKGEVSENDFKIREAKLAIARDSNNIADDQPLSMWIGGIHSSSIEESRLSSGRTANGLNEAREGLADVAEMSLVIDSNDGSLLPEDQSLPFVKKSPIWKTIESMDVFNIVPQKPHFHPLTEMKKEFREGSAIGIMITFADLFEKISKLEIGSPRNTMDSILESLNDLEKHGFDVTLPRGRLNELLSVKDQQAKLLEELEDSEKEITESTNKKTKMGEEIGAIEKKISELAQQSLMIKSKMEAKNLEIASLKLAGNALNERIDDVARDFERIASAPWS